MTRSSTRRGPWTTDEDQTLLDLVQKQGPNNWVRISQNMQHRTPKQCRERYHQNLKQSLNHEPITHQEGDVIEQMVSDMGRRWAEIARRLGNRSDNAVKNWWNGSMNRRKRNGNQHKSMGHRAQPVPSTRPPRPSLLQSLHHIGHPQQMQQGLPRWSELPRSGLPAPSMHYPEAPVPGMYQVLDPHLLDADRDRQHHYSNVTTPLMEPFPRHTQQAHQGGYMDHLPVPSSLPRPQYHAPQALHFSNGSTGDLPLMSPMGSEASSFALSTGQAPSMISDRYSYSSYSTSPGTMPSPRSSMMLAPIDTRAQIWQDPGPRRPESLPSIYSKPPPPDEGYGSAITPNTAIEAKGYHHVSGYYVPRSHSHERYRGYQDQDQALGTDMSPHSAKDARMNVSSLLH